MCCHGVLEDFGVVSSNQNVLRWRADGLRTFFLGFLVLVLGVWLLDFLVRTGCGRAEKVRFIYPVKGGTSSFEALIASCYFGILATSRCYTSICPNQLFVETDLIKYFANICPYLASFSKCNTLSVRF